MPYDTLQVVLETAPYMLTISSTLKSELTFSDISDADGLITSQSAYRNDIFLRDRRVAFVIFLILMNDVGNAHIWYKHQLKNGEGTNTNGKTGRVQTPMEKQGGYKHQRKNGEGTNTYGKTGRVQTPTEKRGGVVAYGLIQKLLTT